MENNEQTVSEEGVAETPKVLKKSEPQFTSEAERRLRSAPTAQMELRLRKDNFRDRSNVELIEVELAILKFAQEEGKREALEADGDDLETCDLGESVGLTRCVGTFLPQRWIKRQNGYVKKLGNFNASFSDKTVLTACVKCQEDICFRVKRRNESILAGCKTCKENYLNNVREWHNDHVGPDGELTSLMPQFWAFEEACEIFEEIKEKRLAALDQEKRMSEVNKARAEKKREADEKATAFIGGYAQKASAFVRRNNKFGTHGRQRTR